MDEAPHAGVGRFAPTRGDLTPVRVQGQVSPCCAILSAGLGTINSTLGSVIGGGLSAINSVLTTIQQFEQQVVWPVQAIAQARGLVGAIQGIYTQIRNIFNIPISSATSGQSEATGNHPAVAQSRPDRQYAGRL